MSILSTKLTSKDLIRGEYYHCFEYGGYIMHYSQDLDACDNIGVTGHFFYEKGGDFGGNTLTFRPATPDEIRHLKACQEAKKYVEKPKPDIRNDYPIY